MVIGDYTIEATRAIVEARLREASHERLVHQFRGRAVELLSAVITFIVVH